MKTTIDHVTEGELNAELVLRDAKIHSNANAIAMTQGNLDDVQSQLNAVKGDINSLRSMVNQNDTTLHDRLDVTNEALDSVASECQSLVQRIAALEALHESPGPGPQPEPLPDPQPVTIPHNRDAYLSLLVSPADFGPIQWRDWQAPPLEGPATFVDSVDIERMTLACEALEMTDASQVLDRLEQILTRQDGTYPWYGGRHIKDWYDNDVHGRSAYPIETLLMAKAASLGSTFARTWIDEMRTGDRDKYSPYKIANTLIAWGPDGGIQQTGKHYTSGWGHGYEGMFVNVPYFLLYCWERFTGEDLISRIPLFAKIHETAKARIKPYYECGLIGPRSSFIVANEAPRLPYEPDEEGLVNYPKRQAPPATTLPQNQWVWRRGDGVLQWQGGINIDVTAPAIGGQRSEFVPRCIGVMNADETAGLPFVHNFKGGCTPRACSGLQLGPIDWSAYFGIGSSYQEDGGFSRPESAEECLEKIHNHPVIEGNRVTLVWPEMHGRRGTNANEHPLNVVSTIERLSDKQVVISDSVMYLKPKPVTLTCTVSGAVPDIEVMQTGQRVYRCDWGTIEVRGTGVTHTQINSMQGYTRDNVPIDEVYNPYKLPIIGSQVFVQFEPATSHELLTVITFD